jgi:hypothetical protein
MNLPSGRCCRRLPTTFLRISATGSCIEYLGSAEEKWLEKTLFLSRLSLQAVSTGNLFGCLLTKELSLINASVQRPDPLLNGLAPWRSPTASTAPHGLVGTLFCLRLTPCVCVRSQRYLFSLRIACAAYLASLLPAHATCAACGLALFSNGVFRVCVRIN